jgi:hypothetical protein
MSDPINPSGATGADHGLMLPPEELAYELRSQEGVIRGAGRLFIGIVGFAFAALAFAFLYLRAQNSEHLWRPNDVTAPTHLGGLIVVFVVAAAGTSLYGAYKFRQGLTVLWEWIGWVTLFVMLVGLGFQIWDMARLPFNPGFSGYTSCFIGWAVMNCALILGTSYWQETLLARMIHIRAEVSVDGGASRSSLPTARLFRANLASYTLFLGFMVVIELFFWFLFYHS